ncbi:MFS transporter [Clostridium sp. MSJ-4]|uniref:MFS transporter n=1 Tax=Clostridium simiarum TaxID=2841506 RepID=A0ABS6F4M2_9CLOT|nr:MFS transporter [Clostridium simiarum]MBU5593460.1 MFS transporter [Clostridium simiarum]
MEKKKNNIIALGFMIALMILAAIAENTRGVFIPGFKENFAINDTEIGFMLTATFIGYITCTYLGGALCEKIGQKKVFIIGIIFMICSLGILSISRTYNIFIIGMTLVSCGLALTSIAINTIVPVLFVTMQTLIMNLVHFSYGLGSALGQRVSGILIFKGVDWRDIYLAVAIAYIVMLIIVLMIKIPVTHKAEEKGSISITKALSNKLVILYILALGFYVFAEVGTGNWFVNYMESNFAFDKSKSSLYVSMFYGIFTIGRLLGGFVVEKFGYVNVVIKSLIIGFAIYILGILLGEKGVSIIAVSGLFFSITFPTIVSTISKVFKSGSAFITGVVVTFSTGINMMLNMLMGIANDNLGTKLAIYLIPLSLLVSISFLLLLHRETKKDLAINR